MDSGDTETEMKCSHCGRDAKGHPKPLGEGCTLEPYLPGLGEKNGQVADNGILGDTLQLKTITEEEVAKKETDIPLSEKGEVSEAFSNLIMTEFIAQMSALNTGIQQLTKTQAEIKREIT